MRGNLPMNAVRAKLTKQQKYNARRLDVVLAAARVFARLGYHQASINNIADELGITAAALYYYVNSKEELYSEAISIILKDLTDSIDQISDDDNLSGIEKISAYMRFHAKYITGDLGRCMLLAARFGVNQGPEDADVPTQRMDQRIRLLIAQGIADGSIRPCDPMILSQTLFGAINTMARWWAPKNSLSPEDGAEAILALIFDGVAAAPR